MKASPSSVLPAFLLLILALFGLPPAGAAEQLYTCGMHPQIIKKQPGNCPICGMALVPIPDDAAPGPGQQQSSAIRLAPVMVQRMNLRTGEVTRGPVDREVRNVGVVEFDERGLHDVTTKYEGWIEKLYVNATWMEVREGDPLFEIYSPDLYNAQLNYLVARRTEGDTEGPLTRAALARLQLFDVSPSFIGELSRTGKASRAYLFRAPAAGFVAGKDVVEGQMVKAGERVLRLADLSTVWVLAQVFESDLPFVRPGQEAVVRSTYGGEKEISARVEQILPRVEEETRTATARLALPNPDGRLRPGMFVDVRLSARIADSAVLVPEMAVLRSGERNTVFLVRPDGSFEPREVRLGARGRHGSYEVLQGLEPGDRVVTSGQFLLDSESQLREAIDKMRGPGTPQTPPPRPKAASVPAPDAVKAEAFRSLALAVADASAALGHDDFEAYLKQLPSLRAAAAAFAAQAVVPPPPAVSGFAAGQPDPADITIAREKFAPFSTSVADLALSSSTASVEPLHAFECPMAPAIGTGRWLQRSGEIRNPFFGSAMPACGEEIHR